MRTPLIFLLSLILVQPLFAQERESSTPSTTQVEVVRAEFDTTTWSVGWEDDDVLLVIRVPNTGTYDARDVTITAATLDAVEFLEAEVVGAEVFVDETAARKTYAFAFADIPIGDAPVIRARFSARAIPRFAVSVTSEYSVPVTVGTLESGGDAAVPTSMTQSGVTYTLRRIVATAASAATRLAGVLNTIVDQLLVWIRALEVT